MEVLPTLNETFDLVFIDADKRDYRAYYDDFSRKSTKEVLFWIIHLWDGKVVETVQPNDKQTQGIHFNDYVCKTNEWKNNTSLRDGLT